MLFVISCGIPKELIKKAKDQGTVFLNAIGNSGKESTDSFVNTGEFIDVGATYILN